VFGGAGQGDRVTGLLSTKEGTRLVVARPSRTRERVVMMRDYTETMRRGEAEYTDVLAALRAAGLPVQFTQTGGMNAALESVLEGGGRLLITDAEDSLPWLRTEHRGWAVGVFPSGESSEPVGFDTTEDGDVEALLRLVGGVFRAAARRTRPAD